MAVALSGTSKFSGKNRSMLLVESQQRAYSPWFAAGLAIESKLDRIPYGRRFLTDNMSRSSAFLPMP